jgi:hypothetical protein
MWPYVGYQTPAPDSSSISEAAARKVHLEDRFLRVGRELHALALHALARNKIESDTAVILAGERADMDVAIGAFGGPLNFKNMLSGIARRHTEDTSSCPMMNARNRGTWWKTPGCNFAIEAHRDVDVVTAGQVQAQGACRCRRICAQWEQFLDDCIKGDRAGLIFDEKQKVTATGASDDLDQRTAGCLMQGGRCDEDIVKAMALDEDIDSVHE